MKKYSSFTISILFLISLTTAAPLQVEVQKLFGAQVGQAEDVTIQSKSFHPEKKNSFSIFASGGDNLIEPGDDLTGELDVNIDCGSADICYADYWLNVNGQNHFASGNTYYASDGETITVTVDFQAPDQTGSYLGYWYSGSEYNADEGNFLDSDSLIVKQDSDGDGIADSSDECPDTEGQEEYNGCPPPDSDGDGINDEEDECPEIGISEFGIKDNGCPIEDSDGDGIPDPDDDCDNTQGPSSTDGCPDSDDDGVIDKNDDFPNDPDCVEDSDADGVCDSEDDFPNDPSVTKDSDNDGVGDSNDQFPHDPGCTKDSDSDGVCDSQDAFPHDSEETRDADKDGIGDNSDEFPNDSSCSKDSDGDKVCDSEDEYPNDPGKTSDSDGDGIADAVDACVNHSGPEKFDGCPDEDGDGVPLNQDQCPETSSSEVDQNGCKLPTENKTDDNTDGTGGTGGDENSNRQIGNSFDRQVFQTLQNLYNSILTLFS